MECLDDATVAVQLEPNLIKAIKKGGFSDISHQHFVKRGFCGLWQVTAPQVSIVSGVSMSAM